jgi:hypothetical protein
MIENINIVFYGDQNFSRARQRFNSEVVNFGFKKIFNFGPENLPEEFLKENGNFIKNNKRGGGYWLWKSYLIKHVMGFLNKNDFLLYVDVGCTLNKNGLNRFNEYIEMVNEKNILTFQMPHLERTWTKQNLITYLNCNYPEVVNSGQIIGGISFFKKNFLTENLINDWYKTCNLKWTIDDSPSTEANHPEFIEHRHDQSVFSLLVKKNNLFRISDETYHENWNQAKNIPIHATRKN